VSNIWLNFVGGVTNPKSYVDAVRAAKGMDGGIETMAGHKLSYAGIKQLARKYNVMGEGFFGIDVPTGVIENTRGIKKLTTVLSPERSEVLKAGRFVGQNIEDNARLAHFVDKLKKGYSPEQAALSVKKYLYDYSELSKTEKDILKRVLPFYTWSRKNIPNTVENLITQPGKVSLIEKARKESIVGKEREQKVLPEWLAQRYAIRFKDVEGIPRYMPLEGYIPTAEILKLTRLPRTVVENLRPDLKAGIELVGRAGYSLYYGKPIVSYEGETKDVLGVAVPAKADYLLRMVRFVNEMDRLWSSKKSDLKPGERVLRYATGIRLYPVDFKKAKKYLAYELRKELGELSIGEEKAIRENRPDEVRRIRETMHRLRNAYKQRVSE
jgi:hypothetical protein